jgi:hypothetical protein
MGKDRMREAALQQVDAVAHELPAEHRQAAPVKKARRDERLVVRLTADELHRLTRYFQDRSLPLSTGARAALLDLVRKG